MTAESTTACRHFAPGRCCAFAGAAAALFTMLTGCDDGSETVAVAGASSNVQDAAAADPAPAPDQPARSTATTDRDIPADRTITSGKRSSVEDNPSGWPPIEFEPAEMDFGFVEPRAKMAGTVTIHNVGDEPLRIVNSKTSCGCTQADDLSGEVIQPGGSIDFNTTMEMKYGLGEKMEKLTLAFAGHPRPVEYIFRAEVALPVRTIPSHIDMTAEGDQRLPYGELRVEALDDKPFRILRFHGRTPQFADGFNPETDEPRTEYTIKWDVRPFVRDNDVPWFFVLETDREDCPVVDVRFAHPTTLPDRPVGRPWTPRDQRILVGTVRTGEPFEVITTCTYSNPVKPNPDTADVRAASPFIDVELKEVEVDGQDVNYRIQVTPRSPRPGLFYEILTVELNFFDVPVFLLGRLESEASASAAPTD